MRESTQSYVLANGSTVIPELCVFCFISYIYCVQEGFNILFYLCSLHYYFNLQQYMLLGGFFFGNVRYLTPLMCALSCHAMTV